MATSYDVLLPEVYQECPGVTTPSALLAIRNAVRHFCEESTAWRYDVPLISTVTDQINVGEYKLSIPLNTQIVSVVPPIQHNDLNVVNKTRHWLDNNEVKWRTMTGAQATYFTMISVDVLRLVPYTIIAKPNSLRVAVALKPTRTSTDYDDYIHNEYGDVITNIAKSLLMLMPGVEWSNPQLGQYYKQKSDENIQEAFSKITSGYSKGKTDRNNRVVAHFF
jgi:hypothetical protein